MATPAVSPRQHPDMRLQRGLPLLVAVAMVVIAWRVVKQSDGLADDLPPAVRRLQGISRIGALYSTYRHFVRYAIGAVRPWIRVTRYLGLLFGTALRGCAAKTADLLRFLQWSLVHPLRAQWPVVAFCAAVAYYEWTRVSRPLFFVGGGAETAESDATPAGNTGDDAAGTTTTGRPDSSGHRSMMSRIIAKCNFAAASYKPTIYAFNGHAMALVTKLTEKYQAAKLLQRLTATQKFITEHGLPKVAPIRLPEFVSAQRQYWDTLLLLKYQRQLVDTPDGDVLAVDWMDMNAVQCAARLAAVVGAAVDASKAPSSGVSRLLQLVRYRPAQSMLEAVAVMTYRLAAWLHLLCAVLGEMIKEGWKGDTFHTAADENGNDTRRKTEGIIQEIRAAIAENATEDRPSSAAARAFENVFVEDAASCCVPPWRTAARAVVLVSPGVACSADEGVIRALALEAVVFHGFLVAVLNPRGCGGVPICNPRIFCAGSTDDLAVQVTAIRRLVPWSVELLAVGISLGGNMMAKFLGEPPHCHGPSQTTPPPRPEPAAPADRSKPRHLASAMAEHGSSLSSGLALALNSSLLLLGSTPAAQKDQPPGTAPSSYVKAFVSLSNPISLGMCSLRINRSAFGSLYSRHLALGMKKCVREHWEVFQEAYSKEGAGKETQWSVDLEHALTAETITEFDERFTRRIYGYSSIWEYYQLNECSNVLGGLKVPSLFVHALDDPICHAGAYDLVRTVKNSHIAVCFLAAGGHVSFLTGLIPRYWAPSAICNFLVAALDEIEAQPSTS